MKAGWISRPLSAAVFRARGRLSRSGRIFLGTIILPLCTSLPGCVALWSEPNEQPIWLSLKDGSISFAWCGSKVGPYGSMVVDSAIYDPGRENSYLLHAVGDFYLDAREPFTLDRLPGELVATDNSTLRLVDAPTTIFIYVGRDADNMSGMRATFSLDSGMKFAESGRWRSPDGKEGDSACDN